MADKNAGKRDVDHTVAGSDGSQGAGATMYAEVDLGKPQAKGAGKPLIDVEGTYGSEADFLKSAPGELRKQLGLKADASPEQVYHKMAHDLIAMFPKASHDLQKEALQSLGIDRSQMNESNVYNALIRRDRQSTGTPDGSSLSDLERAVNRKTYKQMKDGTLPIDYD
jgi:hypothetical protein